MVEIEYHHIIDLNNINKDLINDSCEKYINLKNRKRINIKIINLNNDNIILFDYFFKQNKLNNKIKHILIESNEIFYSEDYRFNKEFNDNIRDKIFNFFNKINDVYKKYNILKNYKVLIIFYDMKYHLD